MADFDDAERHALQEVEPEDQLKWLLEEVDEDLTYSGWLQTQVSPPPGVPQLRCDCVAALHSRGGKQPPWACLIEAQGQPLAGMAVWMTIYLGLLHNVLRYEGRDRYRMMGVILNLSEGELSHEIDWQVPLRKKAEEAQANAGQTAPVSAQAETQRDQEPTAQANAGQADPVPPATKVKGISCVYFIKNVRQESAEQTLDRIECGELGLCILLWIPLMVGADTPEIARRWRDLAMRQTTLHLRGNYAVLALVFAEMAGRKQFWQKELEGFNMQESTVMRAWRAEAMKKGRDEGIEEGTLKSARAAVLNVLEARFPETPVPEGVRSALEKNANVQQLTDWQREAALTASPADFERVLTGSAS